MYWSKQQYNHPNALQSNIYAIECRRQYPTEGSRKFHNHGEGPF